jgi:hypothetical protein
MKNKLHGLIIIIKAILMIMIFLLFCRGGCVEPTVRPGSAFEGSAKWALQKAQPEINNFASDAQLYQILGSQIWKDGRLPGNTGTWSFVCWSNSVKQKFQISVDHLGKTYKSYDESPNPPLSSSGTPIPSSWVNSTEVFHSIPVSAITHDYCSILALNLISYIEAPNIAVWNISGLGSKNHLVRWDGHYIGTQH